VSTGLRKRTPCQACFVPCRVTPLEVMLRGVHGARGAWLWWQVILCPPCRAALRAQLGTPQLQELDAPEDELDGPVAAFVTSVM
jgi:hypothetical protein